MRKIKLKCHKNENAKSADVYGGNPPTRKRFKAYELKTPKFASYKNPPWKWI